jgi:hypothetical protein
MEKSVEQIRNTFNLPVINSNVPEMTLSILEVNYIGSKTPSFPYYFSIDVKNSLTDYQDKEIFNAAINSYCVLYKMINLDEMFDLHVKVFSLFELAINKNGDHEFLKTHKLPVLTRKMVSNWMIESDLFERLINGLRAN